MTERKRPYAQDFSGESKTQQHFAEESNINRIVERFRNTGQLPPATKPPEFGYASSESFDEAMRKVAAVQSAFAELSSEDRQAYGNDPRNWIDHYHDSLSEPEPEPAPEAPEEPLSPSAEPTERDGVDIT